MDRYAKAPRVPEHQRLGLPLTELLHELTVLRDALRDHQDTLYGERLLALTNLVFQTVARQQLHIDLARSVIEEDKKRRGPGPPLS
jgi:hypothetical protein